MFIPSSITRDLAADQGISWNEYWEFLGDFANFRTEQGLQKLEVFLKDKYKKVNFCFHAFHTLCVFTS